MINDYSLENRNGVTTIGLRRHLSLREVCEVMTEVGPVSQGDRRLWELTDTFAFQAAEVRKIAEHGKRIWKLPSRVAYVASNDLSYGLLRMLSVLRGEEHYLTEVFRERDKATAWLEGR